MIRKERDGQSRLDQVTVKKEGQRGKPDCSSSKLHS